MFLFSAGKSEADAGSYVDFDKHTSQKALSAGKERGVVVKNGRVRLGADRDRGTLTSKAYGTSTKFDTMVPSWNARTPAGTWIRVQVRLRSGGNWTPWFDMGAWAHSTRDIKRHSVNGQTAGKWRVLTDTIQSTGKVFAGAYQYRATLYTKKRGTSPTLDTLSFVKSNSYRHGDDLGVPALKSAWGKNLRVPARSQMIYPNGGQVWCSPTSLSMVMAYWSNKTGRKALNQSVPKVAQGTYDYAYRGWGNWPFNTGYAGAYGLEAKVSRFSSIEQAERWIDMGIPVVASVSWNNDYTGQQLVGAPLRVSQGHLMVIRGFTKSGHVIVNDPAFGSNSEVPHIYRRNEFERAWLRNPYSSGGIVYLVHPRGWKTPYQYASKGSW